VFVDVVEYDCDRIYSLWEQSLALQEGVASGDPHGHGAEDEEGEEEEEEDDEVEEEAEEEEEEEEEVPLTDEEKAKQNAEFIAKKNGGIFKPIYRSKGFFWIASRYDLVGAWSQSGVIAQIGTEGFRTPSIF
jgi:G3E family GTPase